MPIDPSITKVWRDHSAPVIKHRFRDEEKERRRIEGQILVVKMIADGWFVQYLAEECGASARTVCRWRDGEVAPRKSQLKALRSLVR